MKRSGLLLSLALAADPVSAAAPTPGFIDDAPKLEADRQRPGAFVYRAPGRSLKGYTTVFLDPILVWYHPESRYRGVEPQELAELTRSLKRELTDDLEPAFPVVDRTGAGVLRIRLAITQVRAEPKKKGLFDYTPVALVVDAAGDVGQVMPNLDLQQAQVEAELLDGSNDTRLAIVVEPLKAGKGDDQQLTWQRIAGVLDAYAKRLRARLDEAKAAR